MPQWIYALRCVMFSCRLLNIQWKPKKTMVVHLPQWATWPDWPAQQLGSCATSVVSSVMWMNPTFLSLWAPTILSVYSKPSSVQSFFMEAYSWQPLTADDMLGSFRWNFYFAVVHCAHVIDWYMNAPYHGLRQLFCHDAMHFVQFFGACVSNCSVKNQMQHNYPWSRINPCGFDYKQQHGLGHQLNSW